MDLCLVNRPDLVAIVDEEDSALAQHRWYFGAKGYVVRGDKNDKRYLHREILGLSPGDPRRGEHKDRNPLNNVRANLRIVDGQRENMQNTASYSGSSSQYRGVSWNKGRRKWEAHVRLDGVLHHLGLFVDEAEAGRVAAAWRAEHMPYSADAR